jgi:hypothetical protein
MILKNLVVLALVSLLAACGGGGEKKVTEIDGTSKASVERTYNNLVYQVKNQGEQIQWQIDYIMLDHYYPEADKFIKQLGGKTLEELNPIIAEAHVFYLKEHRVLMVSIEQKQLDVEQAKLDEWRGMPESNLKPVMVSQQEARVLMYTKSRDAILALTDAQFVEKYGDGAAFPTDKYAIKKY